MSSRPLPSQTRCDTGDTRDLVRVLLVEDDPDDHALAVDLLGESRQTRFAVDWVRDYAEVKRRLAAAAYDVALVDYRLGAADGLSLARECFTGEPAVPFIMLTGLGDREIDLEAMRLGAADYLVKGRLDAEMLERSIRYAIAHAHSLATIATLNAELEQRVRERTAALEYANKELDAFAFSVSHDLRSPLRIIEGFAQIVAEDFSECLGESGQMHLQRILKSSRAMNSMIEALLQLSRAAATPPRHEPVDLSAIAAEIIESLQAMEADRRVETSIDPGLVVNGDHQLLRTVLQNLLGNAWKFSSREDPARIAFGAEMVDGERVFFVRDNGVGFDMAGANRLFGLFQRLHAADVFPGTGAGLAIVERMVHRHGGRVWGEGNPGEGATFRFTLGGWK